MLNSEGCVMEYCTAVTRVYGLYFSHKKPVFVLSGMTCFPTF